MRLLIVDQRSLTSGPEVSTEQLAASISAELGGDPKVIQAVIDNQLRQRVVRYWGYGTAADQDSRGCKMMLEDWFGGS